MSQHAIAPPPDKSWRNAALSNGFTLIELSIVLVIIGLIVGGVLVGQDLIRAAAVRATVTQIEKYNTAANTFYGKYGYLPGDIPATPAAQFGFAARGPYEGQGDGNGLIEGNGCAGRNCSWGLEVENGETAMFWVDLSTVNLIEGAFSTAGAAQNDTAVTNINAYMPAAKLGQGNYIYVWSGGYQSMIGGASAPGDGNNYFGLSAVTALDSGWPVSSNPGLTEQQAYSIDAKIDDGYPQSGRVIAIHDTWGGVRWAASSGIGANNAANNGPTTARTDPSSTTCYENSTSGSPNRGVAGTVQHYSLTQSNGSGVNCALSFQFQ